MKNTLQECKEIVAKEHGYNNFEDALWGDNSNDAEVIIDLANKMYYEQSEWIRVEDRLPESNVNVLLFNDERYETEAYKGYLSDDAIRFFSMSGVQLITVTHWMPLPALPPKQ